ncbi:MAG: branched-chain amino acid ABC transporter permease [Candidatus Rokubacteria bacterium]|nr:branched-chain amino acid ABC transporter permease [Candidatus Rokubacteria bacterium]MBI3105395.1 branched-chain amino acid ABC transporter permease [Candidatus Rokubacteria bacterium]
MDVAATGAPMRLVAGLGIVLAGIAVLPPVLPSYVVILMTEGLIYAIAAASLDLLLGFTGLPSLGHSAFFAVGAYTTAILVTYHQASFAVALVASIALAAAVSGGLAILVLRATGIYFMMITLAVALCAWGLAYRWVSLTGGDTGIVGVPRPRVPGIGLAAGTLPFYYAVLALFAICLALYLLLIWSPFGKTLVGIRDSESRMRVLGYNVYLHKYLALVIAGAFAGVAGSLYAYYNGFVGPNTVDLAHSMQFVLMVIVGGPGTLVGPLIGAFVITFLEKMVSVFTERWVMVLAAAYVVTALWAPRGMLGLLRATR